MPLYLPQEETLDAFPITQGNGIFKAWCAFTPSLGHWMAFEYFMFAG